MKYLESFNTFVRLYERCKLCGARNREGGLGVRIVVGSLRSLPDRLLLCAVWGALHCNAMRAKGQCPPVLWKAGVGVIEQTGRRPDDVAAAEKEQRVVQI